MGPFYFVSTFNTSKLEARLLFLYLPLKPESKLSQQLSNEGLFKIANYSMTVLLIL